VESFSVLAGRFGQADDRVFVDTHQASRLADATTLLEVTQNRDGLVGGESRVEQGSAFAFGEALLAGTAGQQAALVGAVAETDAKVVEAALAVLGAVRVLAAESCEVVHGHGPQGKVRDALDKSLRLSYKSGVGPAMLIRHHQSLDPQLVRFLEIASS
jgi:hypothetical protein